MSKIRAAAAAIALASLAAACTGRSGPAAAPRTSASTEAGSISASASNSSASTSPGATAEPSPSPALLPGLPASYDGDVPASEVPTGALVPDGADVTDALVALTSKGEAIVVMWAVASADPLRTPTGWAAWRRFPEAPAWRPVLGRAHGEDEGVLGIAALAADVTGDGSEDALLFEAVGGSGACGTYLVADLSAGALVFDRGLCDGRVDPSAEPVGLSLTRSIFLDGDPHCCPSKTKTSVLTYAGAGAWDVASTGVQDSGA